MRSLLIWLGFRIHKGWKITDRHGFETECTGCGERRSTYTLLVKGGWPDWQETTKSGDGSCGPIPELPCRWEFRQ